MAGLCVSLSPSFYYQIQHHQLLLPPLAHQLQIVLFLGMLRCWTDDPVPSRWQSVVDHRQINTFILISKSRHHLQEPSRVTFKWNSIAVAVGHIEWNVITISMKSTTRLSSSSSKKMVLLHQDRYFATALLLICCILTGELTLFMQIYPSFLRLFFPPPTAAAAAPHCKYGAMQQQQRIVNLLSSTKPFSFSRRNTHADNADDDHVIWFANETWKRLLLDIRNISNFIYSVCVYSYV